MQRTAVYSSKVACSRPATTSQPIANYQLLNRCSLQFLRRSRSPPLSRGSFTCRAEDSGKAELSLAPVKPQSPVGEMLTYYLKMTPHLFKAAVEGQLEALREERDRKQAAAQELQTSDKSELALYRRMGEVAAAEQRVTLEDVMYVCVLERFTELGVEMLPRIDSVQEKEADLKALTEGVHSKEAVALVKEHVLSVMGPASMAYSNVMVKMSKLQAAQVYAASLMFGYFLRRVDGRFQLERSAGTLPESKEEAVARLERLFSAADTVESAANPDGVDPSRSASPNPDAADAPSTSAPGGGAGVGPDGKKKSALRQYVESFDESTMLEAARLVSVEGAQLVERQTRALFGDVQALQRAMAEAVGQDASSVEELMERVQEAVKNDSVESLTMSVGTQRRAVLEAVAFGTFLRDVESWVDTDYMLLTPASAAFSP